MPGTGFGFLGSPGQPTPGDKDYYHPNACKRTRHDDKCFEDCLTREWKNDRPRYGVPFGTDCQEYDYDVNSKCDKECSGRK